MEAAERIEAFAKVCRAYDHPFPETLINAMCQYLAGQGSLSRIQDEWKAAPNTTASPYDRGSFIILSESFSERLDDLDVRFLDICLAVGIVGDFLSKIATAGTVEQAYSYLRILGIDQRRLLKRLLEVSSFVDDRGQITALGRLLLSLMPDHSGEILSILAQGPWVLRSSPFIKLLLAAQPAGYLDLAEQVAQAAQLQARASHQLGECAALLVKHDYARFRAFARQIAGSASPGDEHARGG